MKKQINIFLLFCLRAVLQDNKKQQETCQAYLG